MHVSLSWNTFLQVHQDDVVFHNRYTKDELKRKVASKLYPPAIQYAVIYRTPPDFDKAASRVRVLEVIISGTDREQFSFPIKVYETVKRERASVTVH